MIPMECGNCLNHGFVERGCLVLGWWDYIPENLWPSISIKFVCLRYLHALPMIKNSTVIVGKWVFGSVGRVEKRNFRGRCGPWVQRVWGDIIKLKKQPYSEECQSKRCLGSFMLHCDLGFNSCYLTIGYGDMIHFDMEAGPNILFRWAASKKTTVWCIFFTLRVCFTQASQSQDYVFFCESVGLLTIWGLFKSPTVASVA